MRKLLLILVAIISTSYILKHILLEYVYTQQNAPWETVTGFYYPNNSVVNAQVIEGLHSIEGCRDWASNMRQIYSNSNTQSGSYECGVGCRFDESYLINICRLTEK